MGKKKDNIIRIVVLVVILGLIIGLLILYYNKSTSNKEISNEDNKKEQVVENNTVEEVDENNEDNDIVENKDNNNDNNTSKTNETSNNTTDAKKDNTTYTEDDVINYFTNIEDEVNNESKVDKFKTTFKDYFTNTIDFIFYDKEIKGHKFKDLTTSAKLKVMASAIKIDSKINDKIPNYKDSLSDKYKDIKNELVMKYTDLTISVCSNHEQGCDKAKELYGEVKEKGKIGFSYIKSILSKGKNKLKDYYEIYKNS